MDRSTNNVYHKNLYKSKFDNFLLTASREVSAIKLGNMSQYLYMPFDKQNNTRSAFRHRVSIFVTRLKKQ